LAAPAPPLRARAAVRARTDMGEVPRVFSLGVVWLALFSDYVLMTIVIPIFPVLGENELRTGMLFSAKAAAQIFSAPLVATVVDDFGLLPLQIGLIIEVLSTLVFAFTQDYGIWFAARAVQGFASACILSCGFLHVQRAYSGDQQALGAAMGTVTTGIISGVVFGPPIGGILYGISAPLPFLILAALLAIVLALSCALSCALRHLEAGAEATEDGRPSPAVSTRLKAVGLLSDKRITRVPNRSPEFADLPRLLFGAYTKTRCFAVCCSERCSPPTRRSLA
jgi:MFS family permease